jgi:hypothetical protein
MELGFAVPQVIAHRVARMATAGVPPSARDRREFHRMGQEKVAAFGEAWVAMAMQGLRANQAMALAIMRAWNPLLSPGRSAAALTDAFQSAAIAVAGQGLAPVHRRAVANAKRLGRRRR